MSVQGIEEVLRKAQADPAFGEQMRHDPDTAFHGYDIEYAERQALISGDASKLRSMGVNPDLALLADAYNPVRQEPTE